MAATTVENLEFHIKKTGMSDDGAKILKSYADALKELKQTGKGNPISQTLVKNISALAGAMKAIDAAAVSKMRQLAAALKTFDGLKGISLNAKFASVLTDIAAAADLLTDSHIDKLTRFGNALKNMQGAKTNIGDKLPEQIKNLAAAVETITDETVNRLNRLTKALSRLRGIDLRGLGSILAEQRRAGTQSAGQANGGTPSAGSKSPAAGQRGTGAGAQMNTHRQWTWSLSENVKIVADQWKRVGQAISSHVNPRIKLVASLLRGVLSVIGSIAKSIARLGLNLVKKAVDGIASAVRKAAEFAKSLAQAFGSGLVKSVSLFASILKSAGAQLKSLAGTSFANLSSSLEKVRSVLHAFGRVAFYRTIRSAIKYVTDSLQEGTKNVYYFSMLFGQSTRYISSAYDQFATATFQMRNQVGAAWATLFAAIQPIILNIISLVTKAAEAVTQLFAAFGGKNSYVKATPFQQTWGESLDDILGDSSDIEETTADIADDIADATEKTTEWKNQLMGFDTLNRLEDNFKDIADSAKKLGKTKMPEIPKIGDYTIPEYGMMFEESPIADWVKELMDLLKKGDWYEIGKRLAEWLNGLLKRLDDWINNVFRPWFKDKAKKLADFINGFVDNFDWKLLGKTVADGLNAVFDGINTFLKNVKWKQLGRGVGDAIKSLFDHTEWDLIGETFANKWNALLHFIEGVVTTPGIWQSIGKGIGKFVKSWIDTIDLNSLATSVIAVINGIAEAIGNFLDQNPFQNLAAKITNALNRVVMEVEWAKLGTNIGRLFQSGLNVLFDVVSKFPFEKLGWNIMQCIDNLAAQINFDQLGHLMMSIGLALWKVVYGAVEYLADTGGAKRLAERLSSFVKGALDELADWLASLDTAKIAKALKDFFGNIDYIGIRDSLVRVVKTGWQKAVELKNEIFTDETKEKMKNGIKQFFDGINWDEIKETIKTKLTTAWNWIHTKYDEWFPPEKREELKQKIFNYIAQAIMSVPWAELHNILQYSIDKAFLPDWWNNWYWSKGDYAGKETIMGMINGTNSKVGDLTNAVQNDVVDAITSASLPAEMAAMAAGAGVSDSLASGVESRKDVLENKTTSGFLDAITSASFKADSVAVTAGTNAMTSAANGVISGKPKVQTAMDGSLVQPADSAVVAFLKKIGIIQSAYAEEAGGWISTADQVKERTVGDYDVIGDKVPKSMDVMQGNLDKTTVLVAKSFQTMDTMSVQAAQSMRDKLKTAFDAAKQSVLNVAQAIDTSMVSMMSSVGTKFVEGARNLIGNIKSFIDSVKSTLGIGGGGSSVFSNIGQSMVSGMSQGFSSLWGTFSSNAVTLVSTLAQTIVSAVNAAITSAAGNITNMVSQAKSTLSNLASNARESISNIVSSSQSTLNNIVSQVGSALNNLISQANAKLQSLRGKSYATGGFPEDGLFFANHSELVGQFSNGRTAVANNAQIIEGIKRGVMEAMQASLSNINNRSGDDQAINIYIGDELVYSGYAAWNRRQQVITGGRA